MRNCLQNEVRRGATSLALWCQRGICRSKIRRCSPQKGRDEQQGRAVRYFVEMQAKWPKGFIQIQLLPE